MNDGPAINSRDTLKYDPKKVRVMSRPPGADDGCIRILLDDDTIVLIKDMKRWAEWKTRYPNARLLDPPPGSFGEDEGPIG